jgi:hypothetical protein
MTYSYLWFSIADWIAETQFDDLECRDPLHVGRAGYSYCFAALNVGLQAAAKTLFASWAIRIGRSCIICVAPVLEAFPEGSQSFFILPPSAIAREAELNGVEEVLITEARSRRYRMI